MAILKAELREILERYEIDPRDKSKLWDCRGTLVLYHRAYEIIAAREGITFDPPVMIENDSANRIVAMMVIGRWKERVEWSVGEAAPGNNKNSYPYAIAEKRAKDRVVAKLVGLAEHVYSEDEADEFKNEPRTEAVDTPAQAEMRGGSAQKPAPSTHVAPDAGENRGTSDADKKIAKASYDRLRAALREAKLPTVVDTIIAAGRDELAFVKKISPAHYDQVMGLSVARKNELLASA